MASTGTTIQTEIERLKKAKADIKTAIINKGGTISDTATIDTYASAIDGISTGGGGGGGVPIVFYGETKNKMVVYSSSQLPIMYSTKENYFPTFGTPVKDAFILRASISGIQTYPCVLPELPKDGTFKLYNLGDINVTSGYYEIPGICIIQKDYSTAFYRPTNFELRVGATLKSKSYLEYTGIDFSDCIMIGIDVGQKGSFD